MDILDEEILKLWSELHRKGVEYMLSVVLPERCMD